MITALSGGERSEPPFLIETVVIPYGKVKGVSALLHHP